MPRTIICISRTIGAGGEAVAKLVAERLGYRYMDEEIIRLAGEKGYDVRAELPTHYDVVINTDTPPEHDAASILLTVARG